MITLYYALQYPNQQLLGFTKDGNVIPTESLHSSWLLEATEDNYEELNCFIEMHKQDKLNIIMLKVSTMSIRGGKCMH